MQTVHFAVANVDTFVWLPPLAGFTLAFFCSMVGISGAFLLMPFQLSALGFSGPAASATNLIYNLIAIPGALFRYQREGRLWWRLALVISVGGLPGTWLGAWLRTHHLAARADFEIFVALVLLYLGGRLLADILRAPRPPAAAPGPPSLPTLAPLLGASFVVGVIGTIYGIGGGSFMVPILVSLFRLPVHAIAGATLAATFLTSIAAVLGYLALPAPPGVAAHPDWQLGVLFGLGGLIGGNLGARCQRHVPQRVLKGLLAVLLLALAARYVWV